MNAPQFRSSARFEVRSRLSTHPWPHRLLRITNGRRNPGGQCFVDVNTTVLVDGFQGSGNSYTTQAIRAGTPGVTLAHHVHAPAQVRAAAALGVPVLLLLRQPHEAVASSVRRWPTLSPHVVLRGWLRYYRAVEPVIDDLVVGRFERVSTDLASVAQQVNERFGTQLGVGHVAVMVDDPEERKRRAGSRHHIADELARGSSARTLREAQALHQRLADHAAPA